MLAVTLALALMVAMLTFYKQASDIRASVTDVAETVGAERAIMGLATGELRSAMVCRDAGLALEGSLTQVRFAAAMLPGPAAWAVTSATEAPPPAERDVQLIGYRLRWAEDEDGVPFVVGIERTVQKNLTAPVVEEGKEIQLELLTPKLRFIRFRFWDGNAWIESWGGGDLPGAVEIVMGVEPLPEGVEPLDYPYETFRRVVFVPAGIKTQGGTVVRGLGGEGGL
jgi:hypothetical protein